MVVYSDNLIENINGRSINYIGNYISCLIIETLKTDPLSYKKLDLLEDFLPLDWDIYYSEFILKDNDIKIIEKCIYLYILHKKNNLISLLVKFEFRGIIKNEVNKKKNINNLSFSTYKYLIINNFNFNLNLKQKIFFRPQNENLGYILIFINIILFFIIPILFYLII